MSDLGKLANLSKRLKQTKITVQPGGGQDGNTDPVPPAAAAPAVPEETTALPPSPPAASGDRATMKSRSEAAAPQPAAAPAVAAAPIAMGSGAVAVPVAVNLDLSAIRPALNEIRDTVGELAREVRELRKAGLGVAFTGQTATQFGEMLSALTENAKIMREATAIMQGGPDMAAVTTLLDQVREQLELQQAQLAAILSRATGTSPAVAPAAPRQSARAPATPS